MSAHATSRQQNMRSSDKYGPNTLIKLKIVAFKFTPIGKHINWHLTLAQLALCKHQSPTQIASKFVRGF